MATRVGGVWQYLKVIGVLLVVFMDVFMEQGQRIADEQMRIMAG